MKNKNFLVIFSIVFIVSLIFILGIVSNKNKKIFNDSNTGSIFSGSLVKEKNKQKVLTFIEDKRNSETDLTSFYENLKENIPSISEFSVKKLDFSDSSVKEYMKKNNINALPAIIFSTNEFETLGGETDIKRFLISMDSGEYFLNIGAIYNPFYATDRGFSLLDKNIFEEIKKDSFFLDGDDKKIIWLEVGDISCGYCQKFHSSGIIEEVLKDFEGQISKTYNHLIVHKGKHFETLECLADQKGKDGFFKFLDIFYKDKVFEFKDLALRLEKDGYDIKKLETCVTEGKFAEKIERQSNRIILNFLVKSTPTSIFINSKTLEYKIVSGFSDKLGKQPYVDAINSLKKD